MSKRDREQDRDEMDDRDDDMRHMDSPGSRSDDEMTRGAPGHGSGSRSGSSQGGDSSGGSRGNDGNRKKK